MDIDKLINNCEIEMNLILNKYNELKDKLELLKIMKEKQIKNINYYENLTNREIEVISYLKIGLRTKEIAKEMYVQENTIKKHLSNIYAKTGKNRYELMKGQYEI